jgi:hypothetical protein
MFVEYCHFPQKTEMRFQILLPVSFKFIISDVSVTVLKTRKTLVHSHLVLPVSAEVVQQKVELCSELDCSIQFLLKLSRLLEKFFPNLNEKSVT